MKKIFYFTASMLLSSALFSCTAGEGVDEQLQNDAQSKGVIDEVYIHAPELEFDEPETRGLVYTGNGVPFSWILTDTIGIYPDKGDQLSFSMEKGIGTNDAVIDGGAWGLKATSTYGAYYPFSRKNYFAKRDNIILDYTGQVEDGIANADHLIAYDYLASNDVKESDGKLTFDMKRLGCILVLRLTVPQAGTYTALQLKADEGEFTTKAKLQLGSTATFTPVEKSEAITMGLKNVTTTQANQVVEFLIMLAPVDLSGTMFTVTLKAANGYLYKGNKTPTSAYTAGKVTRTSITLKLDNSSNMGFGGEFTTEESEL